MEENNKNVDLLDKMRKIRDMAEKEIFEEQSKVQSTKERSIENVIYLGKFEIKDIETDVFMLEENFDGKTNYKIVDENGEKIAIRTEQGIIFTREELSVDKMEELQKAFLESIPEKDLNEMEKEELKKIAKEIGIEEKDIEEMSEIKLEEEQEETEINKDEVKSLRTLQEIKTNIKVNEREQLEQRFNFEKINKNPQSKFVKIAVVHSDSLKQLDNENKNSTKYSFVAIREDGSAQAINDVLEMDMAFGNNNTEETMKFDADNTVRKDSTTKSRFNIKGTNETLSVENGQYGEIKVYYGGKARGSNEIVETQLETQNVRPTSREIRETQSQYKGTDIKNEQIDEADKHFEAGEEEISRKDADGDKNTHTHSHEQDDNVLILQDGTKTTFAEEAKKINCSEETLKRVYNEIEKSGTQNTVDVILEEAKDTTQDIEAQEMGAPTLNRHF